MQPLPPLIRWNRSAAVLLSGFFLTIGLIVYVWWPLAEELLRTIDWHGPWWRTMDWLLIGLFLFMSLTIIARADLRRDGLIVFVATIGGLVIEAWGTQTNLWFYYTSERPPLWIVPAWPIATLCIDRITRLLGFLTTKDTKEHEGKSKDTAEAEARAWKLAYIAVFGAFLVIMVAFVMPTFDKTATILAFLLCVVSDASANGAHRSSTIAVGVHRGHGAGVFPGAVGHDARVLDVLHVSDAAAVRSVGAWDGGRRVLARGVVGDARWRGRPLRPEAPWLRRARRREVWWTHPPCPLPKWEGGEETANEGVGRTPTPSFAEDWRMIRVLPSGKRSQPDHPLLRKRRDGRRTPPLAPPLKGRGIETKMKGSGRTPTFIFR